MAVTFQEAYRMQEDHDGKFLKKIKLLCHPQHLRDKGNFFALLSVLECF
jgi:hypothetical protein